MKTRDIPVTKVWENQEGDSAEIVLYRDGVEVDRVTITKADDWKHTFSNLEFWETYNNQEINPYLTQLDQRLANADTKTDTTATASNKEVQGKKAPAKKLVLDRSDAAEGGSAQMDAMKKMHPLLSMLQTVPGDALSLVGYASVRDTAAINKIIYSQLAKQIFPSDLKLLWGAKPAEGLNKKNVFELYALKVTTADGRAPLEGDVVTEAKARRHSSY